MQVFHTPGVPPTSGSNSFPTSGWTRNSRAAPTNRVAAYRAGSNATSAGRAGPPKGGGEGHRPFLQDGDPSPAGQGGTAARRAGRDNCTAGSSGSHQV